MLQRVLLFGGFMIFLAVLILIYLGLRFLNGVGAFASSDTISPGTCTPIMGLIGAEDIQADHEADLLFVSATDRNTDADSPNPQDGIYMLRLADRAAGFQRLTPPAPDFHPHGLSLFVGADGTRTLMVINHPKLGTDLDAAKGSIEIYDLVVGSDGVSLAHRASITSDRLTAPNDLVAVDVNRFYVVNQTTSASGMALLKEIFLLQGKGNALYYDGTTLLEAADGLISPAGINVSPDSSHVYIAELLGRKLTTWQGDPFSGRLDKVGELKVPSLLDNIDVDAEGFVWVAGHPNAFKLIGYGNDAYKPSPSQIWRVNIVHGLAKSAKRVYENPGGELGAASVGLVHNFRLYMGTVFDDHILECTFEAHPAS